MNQEEAFPTKYYPTPSRCSLLNFLFYICHGPTVNKTPQQRTRVWEFWWVLAPKCWQSCASEHTAALAPSIESVRSRGGCFVPGIGDESRCCERRWGYQWVRMDTVRTVKLDGCGSWSSGERWYKGMDCMDSTAHFKKQERLVLATLLEKSTRVRTKHCPLPRAGLHAPFEWLSTVSKQGAGAASTYVQQRIYGAVIPFPDLEMCPKESFFSYSFLQCLVQRLDKDSLAANREWSCDYSIAHWLHASFYSLFFT